MRQPRLDKNCPPHPAAIIHTPVDAIWFAFFPVTGHQQKASNRDGE